MLTILGKKLHISDTWNYLSNPETVLTILPFKHVENLIVGRFQCKSNVFQRCIKQLVQVKNQSCAKWLAVSNISLLNQYRIGFFSAIGNKTDCDQHKNTVFKWYHQLIYEYFIGKLILRHLTLQIVRIRRLCPWYIWLSFGLLLNMWGYRLLDSLVV